MEENLSVKEESEKMNNLDKIVEIESDDEKSGLPNQQVEELAINETAEVKKAKLTVKKASLRELE